MSASLNWMIIRNNSSFLLKGSKQTFSREPMNLKSKNSFRYNGLIHDKAIGLAPCSDGKGVVVSTKKSRRSRKPGKSTNQIELKRDSRRVLSTISKMVRKNRYRKDLKMVAMRRASALLRSQKPVVPKRTRAKKPQ